MQSTEQHWLNSSISNSLADQGVTSWGIGKKKPAGFVHVYEREGMTDLLQGQGEEKEKKDSMSVWALESSSTMQLWVLCWRQFYEEEGHSSTSLVSYSWWRVCKSVWRANAQDSNAQFGLRKEKRDRFKILNAKIQMLCIWLWKSKQTRFQTHWACMPKSLHLSSSVISSETIPSLLHRCLLPIQSFLCKTHSPFAKSKSGN